jgi:hypothetical protein
MPVMVDKPAFKLVAINEYLQQMKIQKIWKNLKIIIVPKDLLSIGFSL